MRCVSLSSSCLYFINHIKLCNPCVYSTRHMKMGSASRVSFEANLARNASRGASRMSLDNKPRVEYYYTSGTKYHQQSSKCLANFARQIVDREMSVSRFLRFFSSFTCRVLYMHINLLAQNNLKNLFFPTAPLC